MAGYNIECDGGTPSDGTVSGDTGGSSGGGSAPAPQPCTPTNTIAQSSVSNGRLIIDVTTGGSGSGSGSGSGTGTTTPPPCSSFPPPDPCVQANTLASNQAFVNKMNYLQTLKNIPGETTDLMEPDGSFKEQADPTNGGADQTFSSSYFTGSIGFLHNHGNGPGILTIFSAADIASFYTIITQGNVQNPSSYTYALVNQFGQEYLLEITDANSFNTWASTYLTSNNQPNPVFDSLYNNLVNSNNSQTTNEDNFVNFLSLTNAGLAVMKASTTNNKWSKIVKNNDGTYSIVQCN
ncbi:MAG: hypothetical protein JSU01_17020 [Bacteroidetes bacterium]|nr:hypothetical protein [Bacteroidota bacterium]